MDNRQWLRTVAALNRLPEVLKQLKAQQKKDDPGE